jgi:hypothetical protein
MLINLNKFLPKKDIFANSIEISHTYLLIFLFFIQSSGNAQKSTTPEKLYNDNGIIHIASRYLGVRYEAGTLEGMGPEKLRYFSDKFDCVTFVEYVLAEYLFQNSGKNKNQTFEQILQNLRYRDREIDGYGSRIHYFTEWILQNTENGILTDITSQLSDVKYNKKITFMSSHITLYPKLSDSTSLSKVLESEIRINAQNWCYIPKDQISSVEQKIKSGDIIAITTDIAGLDIVHTGFAYKKNDVLYLLHASETEGKVVISQQNLSAYLMSHKKQSGIMVLRCN